MPVSADRPLVSLTVAGIARRDDEYLIVEETVRGQRYLNQPAGHVEPGETLIEAVIREVREETRFAFEPTELLGLYHDNPGEGRRVLRVAIVGEIGEADDEPLDEGILAAHFMGREAIERSALPHRSPFVTAAIRDFEQGRRYPLDLLHSIR
ncbi:NUDIX domain-containing protein [Guyparkeria hydrothermalis]|uniref:NUDIX domain-containing protein n=1 Tax=Guyparkeria hydrothermalis TaxID=923 RepID=UPI00202238F9|nr:NUDIX domain-containing protein [Guyparkeria hydrothermalis]MCL7743661.1 NUDIX domain-containing protein [Guyparkeria hydrothermalis]